MPAPTALLSTFAPEQAAVAVYAAVVMLIGAVELVEWVYCWRRGLLAKSVDAGVFHLVVWDFVPTIVVFGASIVIAVTVSGQAGMYVWLALLVVAPVTGILSARRIDAAARRRGGSEPGEPEAESAK